MPNDFQSRKYQVTINNPLEHGFSREYIHEILASLSLQYWCASDELGVKGTPHTHIYLVSARGGIRFSTLQRKFKSIAHIEAALGTSSENRDYVLKNGKFASKAETSVIGSFEEWGVLPPSDGEKSEELDNLKQDILAGITTGEIIKNNPRHLFKVNRIDEARNALFADDFSTVNRELNVHYYFGNLSAIETLIYSKFDVKDIYRWIPSGSSVRFDGYQFQPILLLHGFESNIPFTLLTTSILSGYPLQLPCRFHNVQAAYHTVLITSLYPPNQLYDFSITKKKFMTNLLLTKLTNIYHVDSDANIHEYTRDRFLN